MNAIEIDSDDLDAVVAELPADVPVSVVNLIRYRDQADYEGTFDLPPLSGEQAYFDRYLPAFNEAVANFGGCELAYGGKVVGAIVGPHEPQWDAIIIGRYANIVAFRDLVNDPDYQANAKPHRTAALSDCRAYVTLDIG